jgi:hypothetical protein
MRIALAPLSLVAALASGCGVNVLASGEAKDPAEDAAIALENDDPDKAIDLLESALDDDPDSPKLLSLLSAAYAQRAGIEPLQFAQRMIAKQVGDSSDDSSEAAPASTGGFTGMFDLMPEPTPGVLEDIDRAVEILAVDLPHDAWLAGDPFKYALYQTASIILHTKALDTNGDGVLSAAEVLGLSDGGATAILAQLASASGTLSAGEGTEAKAAASIAKYQTQIDAMPGDTQEEKLRNYLAQTSPGTTAPTIP